MGSECSTCQNDAGNVHLQDTNLSTTTANHAGPGVQAGIDLNGVNLSIFTLFFWKPLGEVDKLPRERRDQVTLKDGSIYEGEWKGSLRDGFGVQTWKEGAKYEGNNLSSISYTQVNGNSTEPMERVSSGTSMEISMKVQPKTLIYSLGQFQNDKANGFGLYIHLDGTKYEGSWKDDLQEGYGIETWPDNSKYEGSYVKGKKHGEGCYMWADGSKYNGAWVENKICGHVTMKNQI